MLPNRTTKLAANICAIAAIALPAVAFSQTAPSRIVPDSVAPPQERAAPEIDLPETQKTVAPEGSASLTVDVARIIVEGAAPQFSSVIADITASTEGQNASVADLYDIAAQIEALYARSGQILTRVTLPPQNLRDGQDVRILIVEGFIEEVDVSGAPARIRSVMAKRLAGMIGKKGITLAAIERHVLLAGRVPGASITTTLMPGDQLGGVRLVLQADHDPASLAFSTDNSLSDSYDNWSISAQVSANSLLGAGEQIYLLGATGTDFDVIGGDPLRRILGVSAIVPIGNDGLEMTAEYLRADTNGRPAAGALSIAGVFDRIGVSLSYPLVLSRRETLEIFGGLKLSNEHQTATDFGVRLSHDRLRVLNLGLDWNKAASASTNLLAGIEFSQGINGLGARNQADAVADNVPLSRQGSSPSFSKVNSNFTVSHRLGGNVNARVTMRGQASLSGALPSSMQFSLDGRGGLSGFNSGVISADSGASARLELSRSSQFGNAGFITPFVAAAAAYGDISLPTAVEAEHPNGWSLSGGLRANFAAGFTLGAELARAHSNIFSDNQTRLSVNASVQF